jgi:hypothetical protein
MQDIEQAHRVLGLPGDASLEEAVEAYADLKAVWDPERLDTGLREKAARKLEEIELAFEAIRSHHDTLANAIVPPAGGSGPEAPARKEPTARPSKERPTTTLYDDIFSEKKATAKKPFPLWMIALASVILLAAALLFLTIPLTAPDSAAEATEEQPVPTPNEVTEESRTDSVPAQVPEVIVSKSAVKTDAQPAGQTSQSRQAPVEPAAAARQVAREPEAKPERKPTPPPPSRPAPIREDRPKLVRESSPPTDRPADPAPEPDPVPVPAEPSQAARAAFETLKEKSDAAGRLVAGLMDTLKFREWRMVQERENEFWIDVIAVAQPEGREVHLVWSVDTVKGSVRPLSQAARDLQ